jgi:aminopeptidase
MTDQRLEKLANLLTTYSTEIKAGDNVFFIADEAATPWMIEMMKAASKLGAKVNYMIESSDVKEMKLKYSDKKQLMAGNPLVEFIAEKADVLITAWGERNTKVNANIDSEKLKFAAMGSKKFREIFTDRMAKGELKWCGTQYPTYSAAQEAGMSLREYEDFVYEAGLLHLDNPAAEWKKIEAEQDRWVKYLDNKRELHFISEGTDFTVGIEGRKWQNCCGKVNFPDGEIFTSPVEEKINGVISFSFPGIYMGKEIEAIKLTIENGVVIKATADKGEDLLHELLKVDEGASKFGEVAIGTNYGIKKFTRNMLFDEKIGGTIHMALGNSMPEAGGQNRSAIHWDMLCDMREGGKIYADGELFYENGKFIMEILDKYKL